MNKFLTMLFKRLCKHTFDLKDLKQTNIPELKPPTENDSDKWDHYFKTHTKHESFTKRVKWPCTKCGKVFYAHCGLDILGTYGQIKGL